MFNEKTVYDGTSMKDFAAVRNILECHDVEYKYRTLDMERNSWRGAMGGVTRSGGANLSSQPSLMYEITVHQKDYELAAKLAADVLRK